MLTGRTLSLDVGTKRTGVAISDENNIIASPYDTIIATQKDIWFKKVSEIINKEEVVRVVIGLPLDQHGEEGRDAAKIRQYTNLLRKRLAQPVIEWDERFTTVQAEELLIDRNVSWSDRKTVVDKIAAAFILQSYLDSLESTSLDTYEEYSQPHD